MTRHQYLISALVPHFRVETSGGVPLKVLAVFPLPLSYIIKMVSVEQGLK